MSAGRRLEGHQPDDAVKAFLDELLAHLRGTSPDIRRTLNECEAHLRESVERRIAEGAEADQAAIDAVLAFGSAEQIAADFNRAHRPAAIRAMAPAAIIQLWRLGAIGLIAVGVSAVVDCVAAVIAGTRAVFGAPPGTHYGASACAHFLAVQPTAKTCSAAALLEGRDDALFQRGAAGLLGVLVLAAWFWWTRRRASQPAGWDLRAPAALIGVIVFGAAGLFLSGYGVDRAVINTGSGQWISAGAVALAVAAGYAVMLYRRVAALAS